jgi:hypothetical protein
MIKIALKRVKSSIERGRPGEICLSVPKTSREVQPAKLYRNLRGCGDFGRHDAVSRGTTATVGECLSTRH